jgi:hypothetical protein
MGEQWEDEGWVDWQLKKLRENDAIDKLIRLRFGIFVSDPTLPNPTQTVQEPLKLPELLESDAMSA